MTGIDRSAAPDALAKGAPDPVPALLLGRLAVDRRYTNLGIGTALTLHVLATAVELNEKAACRAVVVTALNPTSSRLVGATRFHPFYPDEPSNSTSTSSRPRSRQRSSECDKNRHRSPRARVIRRCV